MLVLSRKHQEKVVVVIPAPDGGDPIMLSVTVVEFTQSAGRHRQVRLGFTGPEHVKFYRKELIDGNSK